MDKTEKEEILSDGEIVGLYFGRDEAAISATEKKYGKTVYSACYAVLGNESDSEECENTVYLKLWNAIPPNRPQSLAAFAVSIAKATAVDLFRRKNREKRIKSEFTEALDDFADFLSDGYETDGEFENERLGEVINAFVAGLDVRSQKVFVKRYYFSEPVARIAAELGIAKRTVMYALAKIKKELKETLEQEGFTL